MILVTVGTELPFDRLVKAVDRWAAENERSDLFAQIGEGGWQPRFPHKEFLEPPEFAEKFHSATLIVAHAGMGTILTALHHGKPLIVVPRRAALGEHRNDHQLATAQRLHEMGRIHVASDENELRSQLDRHDELKLMNSIRIGSSAGEDLISTLRTFIRRRT